MSARRANLIETGLETDERREIDNENKRTLICALDALRGIERVW